jgi:hypothetical protein
LSGDASRATAIITVVEWSPSTGTENHQPAPFRPLPHLVISNATYHLQIDVYQNLTLFLPEACKQTPTNSLLVIVG